jgi:sarcosine oxidase, subunit beta
MAETADVVVIGGGVIGTSIAFALASAGVKRVVLLEKSALASGASGRSSALVRMHYTNVEDARLAWASYPVFRDWAERMGGPPVFRRTGVLAVVGPADAAALRSNVEMLRGVGIDTVALSPGELKTLQPFINVDDIGAAAYEPASGYASPADVVEGFRRQAHARGAQIRQWTPVTRLLRRESAVTGVETPTGRIDAGAVVIAAGAWAPRLCQQIGFALDARPKALDTMLVTRPPELSTPHMVVLDHVQGTYFRPESDVLTIAGVPCQVWDIDPETMATGLPPSAPVEGAQLLTQRFPAMEGAELARGYRAFDCYSPDRHAILGAAPGIDRLYLATAFSGSGFKIAPAVGTCIAELITDGRARSVDISAFRPQRFAEGKLIAGRHPYKPRRDHVEPDGATPTSLRPPTAKPEPGRRSS